MTATPATISAWTLAAGIETELIRAEAATGESVRFANRPMTSTEKRAGVRFGDISSIVEANTEGGDAAIQALYNAAAAALLVELFGVEEGMEEETVEIAAVIAVLSMLMYRPPSRYQLEKTQSEPRLRDLIGDSYTGGTLTVLDEAQRQGQDIADWPRPSPSPQIDTLAGHVSDHPWTRTSERVLHEYDGARGTMQGTVTRGELEAFIAETSQKGTVDEFRQAHHAALGQGRMEMAGLAPVGVVAVASEILDGRTCGPCRSVDGKRFGSFEEARKAYPAGYVDCLGRARCRGVCVYLFG